jgi:hypothetical protein
MKNQLLVPHLKKNPGEERTLSPLPKVFLFVFSGVEMTTPFQVHHTWNIIPLLNALEVKRSLYK